MSYVLQNGVLNVLQSIILLYISKIEKLKEILASSFSHNTSYEIQRNNFLFCTITSILVDSRRTFQLIFGSARIFEHTSG